MNTISAWKKLSIPLRLFSIEIVAKRCCVQTSLIEKLKKFPVYFDHQATTPTDPRVLDAMMPFYVQRFGNAHSKTHKYGEDAEKQSELAREVNNQIINKIAHCKINWSFK